MCNLYLLQLSNQPLPSLTNCCLSSYRYLVSCVRIPINRPSGGMPLFHISDLMDKRYWSIRYIFQLCYRVIQHSQKGYRKNQVNTTFPTHITIPYPRPHTPTHTHTHTHTHTINNLPPTHNYYTGGDSQQVPADNAESDRVQCVGRGHMYNSCMLRSKTIVNCSKSQR